MADTTYTVKLDTTEAHRAIDELVERIDALTIPDLDFEELTEIESTFGFPWWLFFVSAFAGGLATVLVLWVLILAFGSP